MASLTAKGYDVVMTCNSNDLLVMQADTLVGLQRWHMRQVCNITRETYSY